MPQSEKSNKQNVIALLIAMAFALFAFQNCGAPSGSSDGNSIIFENTSNFPNSGSESSDSTTLEGNGSGYAGKATFVNFDLGNNCQNSEPTIKAESKLVLDNNDNFHLVMQNCEDILPEHVMPPVTAYLEHSSDYVLFNGLVFTLQMPSIGEELTQYFCRGTKEGDNQQMVVFDSKVYLQLEDNSHLMDYELANYGGFSNFFGSEKLEKTTTEVVENDSTIEFTTERKITDFLSWFDDLFSEIFGNMFGMMNSNNGNGKLVLSIDKETLVGQVEVFDNRDQSQIKFENLECFAQ